MNHPEVNLMLLQRKPDSVEINDLNFNSGILAKHRSILRNAKFWHKFIVTNTAGLTRNEVLKVILDHLHPLDLIPVFYTKDSLNSNSYFFARNCEAAIEKLCQDNLTIPRSKTDSFRISIILNFANTDDVKIDVQKNVFIVLKKRFNSETQVLDLNSFYSDPDLTEYCPLSQPKIMYFVLHIAKSFAFEKLILSNNGIKLLNPLDVLIGLKLTSIDLSHNELQSLNDLGSLKHFNVKNLKLTGNKFCDCEEDEYINTIRLLCPTVKLLDGILVSSDKNPSSKRYSLCDYSSIDLVNQFLEHFFSVYDVDRRALLGLYHHQAMFSLTCVYLSGQLSSSTAFLKSYSNISRNLKKCADLTKPFEVLFQGRERIIDTICKLPPTEHDPYSFTADLIDKTETRAVMVVTGAFHEKPQSLLDKERFLGFSRTFALIQENGEWFIMNDMLHVYNGLSYQERNSFQNAFEPNKLINKELIPKPQEKSDYSDLISTMSKIANLKEDWAKKCLEECSYDLKASLELFVKLYKDDKFPPQAFITG
ncbi:nuclear RNA export factor 2-like [Anthonomus grandis grandis]|uniref:nuclear RNA export factor 2-like n=1 Tax=Anthonomus grandis grandis TaxID=2921223 RepID=UPI002166028D|nr:nuclear RNA export factor 2-like [Anthonomus grandis grandis]